MVQVAKDLSTKLIHGEKSREEAEKKAATLKLEREKVDSRWCRELEAKQATIANIQAHRTKQSDVIEHLKGEVAKLNKATKGYKKKIEGLEREIAEWKGQVEQLENEVEAEKLERLSAEEALNFELLILRKVRDELDDLKAAHQMSLTDLQTIESRLKFMSSEGGKKEIVEEYRHDPLGKVELSLAIKAGYDHLKGRLPSDVPLPPNLYYPPRVQRCLSILKDLEERGAGVDLGTKVDSSDNDEEEEEGEEEDENGDGDVGGD